MKSRSRREARARSRAREGAPPAEAATTAPEAPATAPTSTDAADRIERFYVPAALLILLVAAAIRLPMLALNPFHHDEGINGYFTTNLLRDGVYAYDPANYHGPSLYYFALASATIFGLTTEAMRLVPVLAGIATVALVFPLRRLLGSIATLSAAALLAVSPAAVYVSRYFIHESLLVCFSLALVVSTLLYIDRRRPAYLLAIAASAALMFTTKETGIITIVVLVIAALVARWYVGFRAKDVPSVGTSRRTARRSGAVYVDGVEYRPVRRRSLRIRPEEILGSAVVFLAIYVLLFSSFFTNFPEGLVDSLATFAVWTQTGAGTQQQPIQEYLVWMLRADAPILLLGAAGGLIAAIRGRSLLWVFVGLWALGITAAYSLIQYKTPWIVLNMLVPLALLGGLVIATLAQARGRWRILAPLVLAGGVAISGYQAIDLNYRHYDDETYPYVFVHTTRQALDLVSRIEATAAEAGTGKDTGVTFVTPDYWPLPWYMRDYPNALFHGRIVDTTEPMIVANVNQEADLARYADRYTRAGTFNLRPGVDLLLLIRNDLAK
ncbi:MAG: flippase activity-associated protein Agl23 [Chloroflexota bacterium]